MAWWTTLLVVVQIVCALAIIVLVLLQHGKGADMGAAFGGGASGSLFGATGSANFLSRSTAILATVFFLATIGLAYSGTSHRLQRSEGGGLMSTVPQDAPKDAGKEETKEVPASSGGKAGEIPK
ncbi:MAG TPA: preprotein translocase subunit SecG [Burkholderiaceae bacterium]|nr:preprotein translocase subunit SecG [Burkholderiaceae bacterium]